jgi:hypothetical protein
MHGGPFPLRCPFPALAIGRVRMGQKYVVQRALSWDRADRPLARIWKFTKLETRQCLRYTCVTGQVYNPQTARFKQTLYTLACGVIVQRDRITPAINLSRRSLRLMEKDCPFLRPSAFIAPALRHSLLASSIRSIAPAWNKAGREQKVGQRESLPAHHR